MIHRFFITADQLTDGRVTLTAHQGSQIRNVLRMKPGDTIIALDNTGLQHELTLSTVDRRLVDASVVRTTAASGEPDVDITLYQSLLKQDKFELVLQKCTETGVRTFCPVITRRTLIRDASALTDNKITRFTRIITEAAEQSHRGRLPRLESPIRFDEALTRAADYDLAILASTDTDARSLADVLSRADTPSPRSIALFIGPEGGFDDAEIAACRDAGVATVNLGPRILRTETAAVVTSALILYELGRMQPRTTDRP